MGIHLAIFLMAIAMIVGLAVLRGRSGGKYNVTPTDVLAAAMVVTLWLLLSGQITKLTLGSEGVMVETARNAILNASSMHISQEVSPFPVGPVEIAERDADATIAHATAIRAQALQYALGSKRYEAGAIRKELTILTQYVFFQYVILTYPDGSLFGMLNAHKLVRILVRQPGPYNFDDFTQMVNAGSQTDQEKLQSIPSFTDGKFAVTVNTEKRQVLQKMQETHLDWLPVIKPDGRFYGVVERSELLASLILDITQTLSVTTPSSPP